MEKSNIKYRRNKNISIFFIILNSLIAILLNPYSLKIFFNRSNLGSDTQLALSVICTICILLICLYVFSIYLLNKGHWKMPIFLSSVSVSVLVSLTLILIIEISFRLFFSNYAKCIDYIYSYNNYFKMDYMKPNLNVRLATSEYNVNFRTNSIGLRGTKEILVKKSNETRIMILGDSFIQAPDVDIQNTMSRILEKMLNDNFSVLGIQYNVLNIARSGWTPTNEREFLEKNLQFFSPDIVLLFVYVGNDFHETIVQNNYFKTNSKSSSGLKIIVNRFLNGIRNIMFSSIFFTFISTRSIYKWPMGRPNQPFYDPHFPNGDANIFKKEYNNIINLTYQVIETEILNIKNICMSNDISFYLFIIPTKEQVDSLKLHETVEFLKVDMDQIDLNKPQRILTELAIQHNIKVFDLLEVLREAGKKQSVYYEIDSHWNNFGHLVVAKAVFNFLSNCEF